MKVSSLSFFLPPFPLHKSLIPKIVPCKTLYQPDDAALHALHVAALGVEAPHGVVSGVAALSVKVLVTGALQTVEVAYDDAMDIMELEVELLEPEEEVSSGELR